MFGKTKKKKKSAETVPGDLKSSISGTKALWKCFYYLHGVDTYLQVTILGNKNYVGSPCYNSKYIVYGRAKMLIIKIVSYTKMGKFI